MLTPRSSKFLGASLVLIALVGYLTVADELRHTGEFAAVTGILVSGAALFVAGRYPRVGVHLSLPWVAIGVGIGMLVGAILDREVLAVCVSLPVGLLMARLFRRRHSPSDAHPA